MDALARDAIGQHDIERREPVGGHHQDGIAADRRVSRTFPEAMLGERQALDGDDGLSRQGSFNFRKIHGRPFTPRRKADKGQADFSWYDPSPRRFHAKPQRIGPGSEEPESLRLSASMWDHLYNLGNFMCVRGAAADFAPLKT
jgi:hypothetical protein